MDSTKKQNIIHQEFEDHILLNDYSKKLKWIRAKADRVYNKKISVQNNYLKKQVVLFQKRIFIFKERTKFQLKRFYNLYAR
ncbi:hypothetical protein K1F50_01815 [Muricauda oceani]|uniref:Transposase n=1 Tax=Flagellimonas oceani TaxID=2698672 RepID=A0A6G7J1W8_9FLAO|nr:hypothetical protein [Allomuricauda oceani]MBW8241518.1 hypothetical protein [Allomuricauda oceani]QII44487.1 hypothetical protein GVT53_07295 [Allomuricauda oceani]